MSLKGAKMAATIIITAVIAVLMFFAVRHTLRHGSCEQCSGNCASCRKYQKELKKAGRKCRQKA